MLNHFIKQLTMRLQQTLPGEQVQLKMAPYNRVSPKDLAINNISARKSAVLILLFPFNDKIHTILIQRPEYAGIHSGQVSFPGGKFEEQDINLRATALREAHEEVGIIPEQVDIIGKLSDLYIKPSNFIVAPYIGYTSQTPDFIIDAHEVDKVITVELLSLNNKDLISIKTIAHSGGQQIKTPYYAIEGLTVWGATAMMISELNAVVEETKFISF